MFAGYICVCVSPLSQVTPTWSHICVCACVIIHILRRFNADLPQDVLTYIFRFGSFSDEAVNVQEKQEAVVVMRSYVV